MLKFDAKTQKRINLIVEVYKGLKKSKFWLDKMVHTGYISQAEAGYIITVNG